MDVPGEIILFAIGMLAFVAIGTFIGRQQDVDDAGHEAWRQEQNRLHREPGESDAQWTAREAQMRREFWEVWRSQPPWGETLKGALIGAVVFIAFYACTVFAR